MKILEFLSQNVPVIVNDLDMLKEFVEKSQGGWVIGNRSLCLCEERSNPDSGCESRELYDLLNAVLNDESLLTAKGKKGYEFLKANMFWEMQEQALYEAVLGNVKCRGDFQSSNVK